MAKCGFLAIKMNKYFDVHPRVFYPSLVIILGFVFLSILGGETVRQFFIDTSNLIAAQTGWLFILGVNIFLLFCLYVAFSKHGKQRLGGKSAKPEFSVFSWFSMIFSAGIGIGLLYFSISEPITHFVNPPIPQALESDRAIQALNFTFLHYGLHAWAIYCLVGLGLAYFAFSKKLPFSLRSIFFPVIGRKIFGRTGDYIDIIAVIATLFGLATSLGLGSLQIASGLNYIFGVDSVQTTQLLIIFFITCIATISVVTGLKKGVKFLSKLNMTIALAFLAIVLLLSGPLEMFKIFIESTGNYFKRFLDIGAFAAWHVDDDWQNNWTIFYWAWWVAWAPFVGTFIARISKGRTIREFVLGVLLVPSLMTFFWISIFGGSALTMELETPGILSEAVLVDNATSLFIFLDQFPLASITSFVGIFMVAVFFVTSSDSGSLVIDSITAGGKFNAPVGQRILWAFTEGLVAAALLIGGGLKAMQTASLSSGILFLLLLFVICFSLLKSLNRDWRKKKLQKR